MIKNLIGITIAAFLALTANHATAQKAKDLKYYNVKELVKEGKAHIVNQADYGTAFYTRLPQQMEGKVRKPVWDLGQNSAGIAVLFCTDSKTIGAKWTLLNNFSMAHMPGTGIRGLDLYSRIDNQWYFTGTAQPNGKESINVFARKLQGNRIDYIMYLPLYDGITELNIGVDSTAAFYESHKEKLINTAKAPILFYGTSITQGGCASRPGMVYTSMVQRNLGIETINLGFSGNGRMDRIMADAIAKLKTSAVVIDCLPNCTYQIIKDSADYFVRTIAAADPQRPVFLVSNFRFPAYWLTGDDQAETERENALWKETADKLKKEGFKNIHYIDIEGKTMKEAVTGPDYEYTVDGIHLTDLGFMRMGKYYTNMLKKHIK